MHNFSVSNSFPAASTTASISTTTSQDSQLGTADGQHPRGSFMGLLTTPYTPAEFTQILSTYYQQDELRLLSYIHVSDMGASQTNPFEVLATHQTVTFGDDDQGQSASPLSLFNEPSRFQKSPQSVDDVLPIVREEQSPDPTDEWIIVDKSQPRPYKCGYPRGCDKSYLKRCQLIWHVVSHTGKSKFKCLHPECVGNEYFGTRGTLNRHLPHNTPQKRLSNVIAVTDDLRVNIILRITRNMCILQKMSKNHQNERKNNCKLKNFYNSG